jgi:uncharacterized membrane protein (UPF0127 family)
MNEKDKKQSLLYLIAIIVLVGALIYMSKGNEILTSLGLRGSEFRPNIANTLEGNYTTPLTVKRADGSSKTFEVEIADTPSKTAQGLMNRTQMKRNEGMVFIFVMENEVTFWMKDTLIPLDMIFLDSNKKITKIFKNTKINQTAEVYSGVAKYVIEVNAGITDSENINLGDQITF